jgi:hypothetical protein
MKNTTRRRGLLLLGALIWPLVVATRARADSSNRFEGLGMELRVDAMAGEELLGVEFFAEGADCPFYASSVVSLKNREVMTFSPDTYANRVRVIWRDNNVSRAGKCGGISYEGPLLGDHLVPMGERIPQEVIDSIRKDPGQLRMKFRLSQAGVYFGWDIDRRPSYDPNRLDSHGQPVYVPPVHSMIGGDFREAEMFNGKAIRKGWYIDKKTGQRIETDF